MEQKKVFGLFVYHELLDDGSILPRPSIPHLICCSTDMDKLLEFGQILKRADDLLVELLPKRGYRSRYRVAMHCVEYLNNDGSRDYAFFNHLSSALDFINSNFK